MALINLNPKYYTEDEIEIITPDDGYHYFFAYYDLRATDSKGQNHLCHRVSFMDRDNVAEDEVELGILKDKKFIPFAKTTAWNFQQGALLQYSRDNDDIVYYNVRTKDDFATAIHNLKTGEVRYTDKAVATISPDGKYGLAVNFSRIFDYRAGYGYPGVKDKFFDVGHPKDDGIFLTDMATGKSKLLVSYEEMLKISGYEPEDKILVNHITFSPNSDRYNILLRRFPRPGIWPWTTTLAVGDLNGNIKSLLQDKYCSHYWWVNNDEIIAHADPIGKPGSYSHAGVISFFWDGTIKEHQPIGVDLGPENVSLQKKDIHCSVAPDGKYIMGDGYPREFPDYRPIFAMNPTTGECRKLMDVYSEPLENDDSDIRCDLHMRFTRDNKYITFDTIHNGKRQIARFPYKDYKF